MQDMSFETQDYVLINIILSEMAEEEPKELTRDNLKIEMIDTEQPASSSSSCACKWEDGCPEFSNVTFKTEPTKTEPYTSEDRKEVGNTNSCIYCYYKSKTRGDLIEHIREVHGLVYLK